MDQSSKISCPKCQTAIDVNQMLYRQLEGDLKQKYDAQLQEAAKKQAKEAAELAEQKKQFEEAKKRENELFKERLEAKLKEEKSLLSEQLKRQLAEENSELMAGMQKELQEKSDRLKEYNKMQADLERLKREKTELKEEIEMAAEKKFSQQILLEKDKIKRQEEERMELAMKELQKQLADQKKLTEEMKRKQEQGSMQLQGEVQELAIEEWLESAFPLDTIEEIKKGARGADCVQIVNTRNKANCGKICYESKRTKDFQPTWIEKFKADIRDKGADIGVLVTEVMPSDMTRLGMKEGIWICTFEEFKGLSNVLRESIIRLSAAVSSQENKGDKMGMLYDFLTSNAFKLQIEAIVEGFTTMKNDLESEKRSMQRIWKSREKQIEKVVINTIDMYGSIKGIAGNAIGTVKALELPGSDEDDDEQSTLKLE